MSKKGNYFQKQLGLDAKTSEAIKILMDEVYWEEEEEEAGLTASLYYKELTNEAIEYISIYVTKSNLKVPSTTFL